MELKRYLVKPTVDELVVQGLKYYTALMDILKKMNKPERERDIEVVFVLGHNPRVVNPGALSDDDYLRSQFARIRGRHFLYDELIEGAKNQYEDYLSASDEAKALDQLLGTWGSALTEVEQEAEIIVKEPVQKGDPGASN